MPGYYHTAPDYPEPPGYGFYQDDASLPWPDLINPYPLPIPGSSTVNLPPPWYQAGYEPAWDGELQSAGLSCHWHDQHNEYGDAYDRLGGLDPASLMTQQW